MGGSLSKSESSGLKAAGGVAGLALASEAVGTFVAFFILNRVTKAESFADLIEVVAAWFKGKGWVAYPLFSGLLCLITIVPLMSALALIILSGTLFGPLQGTIMVALSLSSAATFSAIVSRRIARARGFSVENIDKSAAAVDRAIALKPWHTSLLLVTLLRLSPILPFTFSNYLAGVTSLPISAFALGTLLGCIPTQAVYVSAGALGRKAIQGGVKLPLPVIVGGVVATAAAIILIGHVATQTLNSMDLDGKLDGKRSA
jgi:uncharacterized membrane protein YdjX (TVP38/TMEM64 family)